MARRRPRFQMTLTEEDEENFAYLRTIYHGIEWRELVQVLVGREADRWRALRAKAKRRKKVV